MKCLHRHRSLRLYSLASGESRLSIDRPAELTFPRYELSMGSGLPFGALFSGLQVSQASYLWSMEFWGTACSKQIPARRRIGIISVISIAIFLAATIGPSSAILLLPRLAYWPAGSTDIWLNATFQDIWPDRSVYRELDPSKAPLIGLQPTSTNGSLVSTNCLSWDPVTYDVDCPSSDWQAIQKTLDLTSRTVPQSQEPSYGQDIPTAVQVTGRSSLRQLFPGLLTTQDSAGVSSNVSDFQTFVTTTQHVAVADALSTTGDLWRIAISNTSTKGHGSVLSQLDAVNSISQGYYQPYTSVVCEYDVIHGSNDTDPVAFPAYPSLGDPLVNSTKFSNYTGLKDLLDFSSLTKSVILSTPGPEGHYRLRWVELPFNCTAIGAIVLKPRSPLNTTQEILTCSIGAGWGLSTMNTSTVSGNSGPVSSQVDANAMNSFSRSPDGLTSPDWDLDMSFAEQLNQFNQGLFFFPIFPQRPIVVTEEWARYLNPTIDHLNTTIFNHLMGLNPGSGSIAHQLQMTEMVLSEMMANGLSRIGSTSQLQGTPRQVTEPDQSIGLDGNYWFAGKGNNFFQVDPAESKDWVKFRVSTTVNGYAYNTHGATPKIAICLLLIYCLLVIIHMIYACVSGISSTCWDSIGEVTALAMNSTPTTALRNTCAGITELNIYKLPVRVLAFRDEEGDGEHLELVFGDLDEKTLENKTIKANRVYGTMPAMKGHEKVA